jgi:hypothetical protein
VMASERLSLHYRATPVDHDSSFHEKAIFHQLTLTSKAGNGPAQERQRCTLL